MGKTTGFLEYERQARPLRDPLVRIKDYKDFHKKLNKAAVEQQAARCMNCGIPFCQSGVSYSGTYSGCPLHNLIPEYNDRVYCGNWDLAWRRLSKTNNFPEFTGRVCPALCEDACVCDINGEAVTSHDNEYAIIETAFANGWVKPEPPKIRSGKKVAVIGSGPSGLAAADCLNKRGHSVTVFERDNRPGGLLMYGIPNMKLDKTVIKRRIDLMREEGVEFNTGMNVGAKAPGEGVVSGGAATTVFAKELLSGFDAVILCCGSKTPRDSDVPGRDASGVYFAVNFLASSTLSVIGQTKTPEINCKGKHVVIAGGGDTGNDCVATAVRQGAKSIVQLDRNPKAPENYVTGSAWPLRPKVYKADYGQQEAIAVFGDDPRMFSSSFKEIIKNKEGAVSSLVAVGIEKTVDKKTGKRVVKEVKGSEKTIPCDLLILATGFSGCESYVAEAFGVERTRGGTLSTGDGSFATNVPKVFAAGDARRGSSLVVWAIAEGRACAKEVDEYLMGYSNM